ncbi:arginase family protein [Agromyces sp. CFH 90414]|uniref:Arginase family protein n=1 Tax=Agromyces agglutinans TaxID=2662258 RepID=A0A6I2F6J5_9MICO|nr:arginase family protein [Agromyces agglutinans]MRG59377.1 arginase family protein [Agromyces agglutinans]
MIALISAPTNLGLRPPARGAVPGTAKAPEALREAGLFDRFLERGARDAGVVLPGRYLDDDGRRAPGRARNEQPMLDHARRLSDRLRAVLGRGESPLVVGGDCSLLIGAGHALAAAGRGRIGLVHIDGHTDFRHPGNSDACGTAAGEDLAIAIGRHWPALADLDGRGPYFDAARTVHLGCRDDDEHLDEVRPLLAETIPASEAMRSGMADAAARVRTALAGADGYWLHLDVDVLDASVMPAVDSPSPGGLDAGQLTGLLRELAPGAVGAQVTVFDPDLDPEGRYALTLAGILAEGLRDLGSRAG